MWEKNADMQLQMLDINKIAETRKFDSTGISPIIPLPNSHQKDLRSGFVYDNKENCYWCPEGHRLNYRGKNIKTRQHSYCVNNAKICQSCKRLTNYTNSKSGRWIKRHFDTGLMEKWSGQFTTIAILSFQKNSC
jgi:hypothetical protein